jgi:hypothetical protein
VKKRDKSLAEVVDAKSGAFYDAECGNLFIGPAKFVELADQGA